MAHGRPGTRIDSTSRGPTHDVCAQSRLAPMGARRRGLGGVVISSGSSSSPVGVARTRACSRARSSTPRATARHTSPSDTGRTYAVRALPGRTESLPSLFVLRRHPSRRRGPASAATAPVKSTRPSHLVIPKGHVDLHVKPLPASFGAESTVSINRTPDETSRRACEPPSTVQGPRLS